MKRIRYSGWFKAVSYVLFVACVTTMYLSARTLVKYDVSNIISADQYTQSPSYKKKQEAYAQRLRQHTQALRWLQKNKTLDAYALGRLAGEGYDSFTSYNLEKGEGSSREPSYYKNDYEKDKATYQKQLKANPLPGENSNFRYVIYDKSTGEIISSNVEAAGDGVSVRSGIGSLRSGNFQAAGEEDGYVFAGNVDETFPQNDDFQRASAAFTENYKAKGKMPVAFAGLTIGGLIAVWLLWYLLSGSGIKEPQGKVRMSYFDRIYTEIFYAMAVAVGWITYGLGYFCVNTYSSTLSEFWRAFFVTVGGALGLSIAMSTFKRVRTGALVYHSLFYRLFVLATRRWSATGRMILVTVSMAAIGMAMVAVACIHSTVAIVLALCFHGLLDIAVIAGFICWATQTDRIRHGLQRIVDGNLDHKIKTGAMVLASLEIANNINRMTQSMQHAVEEQLKSERLKSELITNVSHDIKTPLTSIINYVDLLKKEPMNGEHAKEYLEVLDKKSQRLKELTENLVEASKASTGNVNLVKAPVNMNEMMIQAIGEFEEKFSSRGLQIISALPEDTAVIHADGRYVWRILENLFSNAFKYAMEHTRVYVDLLKKDGAVVIEVKNISQQRLNISADELMERFVRGDASRNTEIEGSGLGLSIAQNLTQIQDGTFRLFIDGDLFKAVVEFPAYQEEPEAETP